MLQFIFIVLLIIAYFSKDDYKGPKNFKEAEANAKKTSKSKVGEWADHVNNLRDYIKQRERNNNDYGSPQKEKEDSLIYRTSESINKIRWYFNAPYRNTSVKLPHISTYDGSAEVLNTPGFDKSPYKGPVGKDFDLDEFVKNSYKIIDND